MSRELFILILILSSFSYANAGESLVVGNGINFIVPEDEYTINVGESLWIGHSYDSTGPIGIQIACQISGIGGWTGSNDIYYPPIVLDSPEPVWHYTDSWLAGWGVWEISLDYAFPGVGGAVELKGLSSGSVDVYLNGLAPIGPSDVFTLHVIPEPATVLLLGLGGLTILRRKKL